jgi:hypothetical protein
MPFPVKPSAYETVVRPKLDYIYVALSRGMTKQAICSKLGISVASWNKYFDLYHEFREIVKNAEEEKIAAVEAALFRKAVGTTTTEIEVVETVDGEGNITNRKRTITKQLPGDFNAQAFILKNRKPDIWRDMKAVTHDGEVKVNIALPIPPGQPIIELDHNKPEELD